MPRILPAFDTSASCAAQDAASRVPAALVSLRRLSLEWALCLLREDEIFSKLFRLSARSPQDYEAWDAKICLFFARFFKRIF